MVTSWAARAGGRSGGTEDVCEVRDRAVMGNLAFSIFSTCFDFSVVSVFFAKDASGGEPEVECMMRLSKLCNTHDGAQGRETP